MSVELTRGIVRILNAAGHTAGAGFVLTDDGLIITCAHVIKGAGAGPGDAVQIIFHVPGKQTTATVQSNGWRDPTAEDIAFLRLDQPVPAGIKPLPLGQSISSTNHAFETFGFPAASPHEGVWGTGTILKPTTINGVTVLQLQSTQVSKGFSGGPVLDTIQQQVVGMVTAIADPDAHGRQAQTAFITPTETLAAAWPTLPMSQPEATLDTYLTFLQNEYGRLRLSNEESVALERIYVSLKADAMNAAEREAEHRLEAFKQRAVAEMPDDFKAAQEEPKTDWTQHPDATYLALSVLIGAWQDKSQCDLEAITQLLGISYDEWLKKAREILHCPDSPLSLRNGIWKVVNRAELWNLLGSRILDQNLDTFRSLAVSVLKEPDPAFELPAEERYAASIHGKVLKCSYALRKGIAEGLAILGSQPKACGNCSQGKAEATCVLVMRELLTNADWVLWGSLNDLLPTLAEAAPGEFLDAVEKAMRLTPCPFDELFSQEGNGITGSNYLTGLLWALEGLAWDEQYLVRVCVALAELASHDPGGQWANRPSNSLTTILLPWLPQTLASVEKRKVAVRTILNEWPDIAWNLIIQLLPGQHQTSFGSHKPSWRKTIPDDWEKGVTHQEYWQQASFYAELAVAAAGQDTARLSALIDHFDKLPEPAFDQLLQALASRPISELPEEQRLSIWDHLTKFTNKHRWFSDAKWALPDEIITHIEQVAEQLAPNNPFNLYQHLFTNRDFDLYEENGDWEEQRKKLDTRRETAISEIFQQNGAEGVIRFAESVSSPGQVGHALDVIVDSVIERTLLPHFLDSVDNKRKALVSGFIWRRYYLKGWEWCDDIEKSDWTPEQVGQFLVCLPFTKEAWDRASEWLQAHESEYWTRTGANAYQTDGDLAIAIEKLIEHGRPHAAINCLDRMRHAKQPIDSNQCVRALLAALSSSEPSYAMDGYRIVELIKFLQAEPSVNQDDLFRVEWAYVPLLGRHRDAAPQLLESRLANDPKFFCEVIRLIYRSKKEDQPSREPTEELKAIATNAWRLLHEWKTPPGTQKDGTFSEDRFTEWLQRVKEVCMESGHLEVALINIGEVLIHTPTDPDGLWIHRAVAAALNYREADDMRDGFATGTYKSRGFHRVDPTGKPERELAEQFRRKAEEVENAGFQRFAVTLRDLADSYDREAERIINNHKDREDE